MTQLALPQAGAAGPSGALPPIRPPGSRPGELGGERPRILVVDDEPVILRVAQKLLGQEFEVATAGNGEAALAMVSESPVERNFDVVLLDIMMPRLSGLDVLRRLKGAASDIEVVMMTAYATIETAVEAVKLGAYDFLTKPFENIEAVALAVRKAAERRRLLQLNARLGAQPEVKEGFEGLIGASPRMREIYRLIDSVANSLSTVLLFGESGTGKDLVARAIHRRGPRRERPFVAINCTSFPEALLERELFGQGRGGTGGAGSGPGRPGLLEAAQGGTLFLDEVADLPAGTQARLLRTLQEGQFQRIGGSQTYRLDVRLVAATQVDLHRAAQRGAFREDLYYRLNVIPIELPPLRERGEDIPLLAYHFLKRASAKVGREVHRIDDDAMQALRFHRWVGNVRELENAVERAVVLGESDSLRLEDLPLPIRVASLSAEPMPQASYLHQPYSDAKKVALGIFERTYLEELLRRTRGSVTQAARLAGLDRSNLRRLLKRTGLS